MIFLFSSCVLSSGRGKILLLRVFRILSWIHQYTVSLLFMGFPSLGRGKDPEWRIVRNQLLLSLSPSLGIEEIHYITVEDL